MNHTLESVCRELRLSRIPSLIDSVEVSNKEEWLLELLIREVEAKEERRIQRLIKQAKFQVTKPLKCLNGTTKYLYKMKIRKSS